MTATKYTYSITDDTLNGALYTDTLVTSIRNSAIVTALDYVDSSGDVLDIWMKAALSGGDETILDGVVAAHDGINTGSTEKRMEDGKLLVQPDIFNLGTYMNCSGVGDDITNGTRFGGSDIKKLATAQGEDYVEFQLMEWVGMTGVHGVFVNATFGDWIGYQVYAPAQPSGVITSNDTSGAYDKQALGGGLSRFKPHDQESTRWDLDITSTLNANVAFSKAVVAPAAVSNGGYFDYNKTTNTIILNSAGTGKYDIYDAAITLGKLGVKVWIIGTDQICMSIPAVRPRALLPHWIHKVKLYDDTYDSENPLGFALNLISGRENLT
jgi:hypothetical protein